MGLYNWSKLVSLSYERIKDIQSCRFLYLLRRLVPYSPFYSRFYESSGVDLSKIKSIDDITQLPFSEKSDLIPTTDNPNRAKDFILQPTADLIMRNIPISKKLKFLLQKIAGYDPKLDLEYEFRPVHVHFTTGRSAAQIPFAYTKRDIVTLEHTGVRLLDVIGAKKEDIAINCFPYAPHLAFWFTAYAAREFGILCLHTGGGKMMGTQKIIEAIERLKPTILVFIPSYAYHLFREAQKQGRNFSSVKTVVFGGERVSPGLRDKVKGLLSSLGSSNPRILATYASTESKTAWVQCCEDSGYHLYPDLEYIEVVDELGRPVKEGQSGEIVYTSLDWRGSVVIRYKTGDICKGIRYSEPCRFCGRTVPRLHYDIERKSDRIELNLTKIKGELVNLNSFYRIIHSEPEVDEWQVEIRKKNNDPFDLDEMILHISLKAHKGDKHKVDVIKRLEQIIRNELSILPKIEIHSTDELVSMLGMERELKEKRILDLR